VRSPGTFQPRMGSLGAAPSPIGLTAADLFAGGEVSRADSRVRWPGTFTDACCPAVRSALDGVLEAYHNPAAVWWGPLQLPRSSRTRWSLSIALAARVAVIRIGSGWTNVLGRSSHGRRRTALNCNPNCNLLIPSHPCGRLPPHQKRSSEQHCTYVQCDLPSSFGEITWTRRCSRRSAPT
jgi:hypothetical protein